MLTGTIINMLTVLVGALIGSFLKWLTNRFSDIFPNKGAVLENRLETIIMQGIALCVLLIGISGSLKGQNTLMTILSMAIGALIGELLDLDGYLCRFGAFVERKLRGGEHNVAEGFVTATLLFCVGAMTVTGAIESGVLHAHTTYYTKAVLDMTSAVVLASTLGIGVLLSAVGVLGVQAVLTLIAMLAAGAIPVAITGEMTAVGSLLVVGIGTNLLGVTKLKLVNMLPAMFLPIALCPLFELIPIF